MKKYFALISILTLCSFTYLVVKDWGIAQGYSIKFDGKYAHGSFNKLTGTLSFDPENLSLAKFDVVIDVASIDTGIELKNKHARSDKWFDAEKFPVIHFTSSEIVRLDTNFIVPGSL